MQINYYKIQKAIAEFIYLFIILFFCYTAVNKLMNLESFRTNLVKTSIFSIKTANYFSYLVIIIELFVVTVLLFFKQKGLLLFCFLILIFTLYISFLRFKGFYEVCGCGGILNGLQYKYHILINLCLIIGSIYCYLILNKNSDEK
ncbi:MauE/DoxX family redox-associated membrane protein [Flavobacterium sp.]|uniref:MauE/DoxX family redox-associated membrane protein n=1 Tax=Flavobacterium sp. TaxID=239 RepID=UPI0037531249